MNMRLIIQQLAPGAHCSGPGPKDGNEWKKWKWDDPRPKPTWAQIQSVWVEIEPTVPDPAWEVKITERMDKNARDQAIAELKAEEEIPEDYQPKTALT